MVTIVYIVLDDDLQILLSNCLICSITQLFLFRFNMNFEQQLQQWVTIDNQMKLLTDKLKELRDKKSVLSEKINTHIETSNMNNTSINIGDGKLKFVKVKETQQLTFTYLETCLSEIIKNEEQVKKIVEYVKNRREVKYIPEIKRLYTN
jgi:hypothetical protein